MKKTGLFYRRVLNRTISNHAIEGLRKDKTRITNAFTANADGTDKLEPFFIGHSNKQMAFKRTLENNLDFTTETIQKHG